MPSHVEAAARDDGAKVFTAIAAETIQTEAETHDASEAQNAPCPDGSGSSKTFIYVACSCRRHKDTIDKPVFVKSIDDACYESALWLHCGTHLRKVSFFKLYESHRRGRNFNLTLDQYKTITI